MKSRWEVVFKCKTSKVWKNIFLNGKSFSNKRYAEKKAAYYKGFSDESIDIRELKTEHPDTIRLNWLCNKGIDVFYHVTQSQDFRAAIDEAMK